MPEETDDQVLARLLDAPHGVETDIERASRLLQSTTLPDRERLILERYLQKQRGIPVIPLE